MIVTDNGESYRVDYSADEVWVFSMSWFNLSWPSSLLPVKPCFFEFDKVSGDLSATNCDADASEVQALIQDAQKVVLIKYQ